MLRPYGGRYVYDARLTAPPVVEFFPTAADAAEFGWDSRVVLDLCGRMDRKVDAALIILNDFCRRAGIDRELSAIYAYEFAQRFQQGEITRLSPHDIYKFLLAVSHAGKKDGST